MSIPVTVFDNLTQLASEICDAPMALISFVDQDLVWFKSRVGFDAPHVPREHAFCTHVVEGTCLMVVEDAAADRRFQDNVYVQAPQGIRFYAGIPLVLSSGHAVGTLAVVDHKARTLSDKQLGSLKKLALLATALIDAKRTALRLQESEYLHPQDKDHVLAQVQSHLDAQTSHYANEHRVICKDGSTKWMLGRGRLTNASQSMTPVRW